MRSPTQAFKDIVRRRRRANVKSVSQEFANQLFVNPLCSDYENVFAQVQPLINDMVVVRPFGVGPNGGPLPRARTPELNLLDNPNDEMGWGEFARAMFATWLTEDELDIHVHRERNRVIGYTILPPGSKSYLGNNEPVWLISTVNGTENITREEVMQLRFSRSPRNLQKGISPATAVRAWAQTEDVMAQYQKAYIENGAIPASVTFIRASTREKFDAAVNELEASLQGPKNRGKTIYLWRQFDNDTGEEKDQVEIKTIQGNNSTLAIKELATIINDHLNKAYGVSNFILGDDSSAKYDNAELSDFQFTRRRVYPALVAFWDQFQFELDRITGGLGYAIQFELEIPDLTERQKVRAEISEKNVASLISLLKAGSDPTAAVEALNLPDSWKGVARGIYTRSLVSSVENKNNLANMSHDSTQTLKIKIPDGSRDQLNHEVLEANDNKTADELPPMNAAERKIYDELVALATRIMEQEPELKTDEVIAKITEVLKAEAERGGADGAKALEMLADDEISEEIKADAAEGIVLSATLTGKIENRTAELVNRYGEETRELFEEVLNNSEPLSANEIRKRLREVMPTWKAERIARNETVYAFKSGRLDEDKYLADKYGFQVELTWRTSNDPNVCPVCRAMDGKKTMLGASFPDRVDKNGEVLAWNQDSWNDDGQIPSAHVNCRCYFNERLVINGR